MGLHHIGSEMVRLKHSVKLGLRRLGYEVSEYKYSVSGQRAQLLRSYSIGRVLDVGANVGQYASTLREAGYAGQITSIEPLAEAFQQLAEASAKDAHWDVQRCALGATPGELRVHVSEGSIFSSPLEILDAAVDASPNARVLRDEIAPMTTVDDVLAGTPLEKTAIKIDVQGFERDVLEGASKSLSRVPMVEMELSPRPVYKGQMLMDEALAHLGGCGLVLAVTENLLRDKTGRSLQFNGIFVRR